jgi:hypothetical protein
MPVVANFIHSKRCTSGLYKIISLIPSGRIVTGIIIDENINNA